MLWPTFTSQKIATILQWKHDIVLPAQEVYLYIREKVTYKSANVVVRNER